MSYSKREREDLYRRIDAELMRLDTFGKSEYELAKQFGCSRQVIQRRKESLGIKLAQTVYVRNGQIQTMNVEKIGRSPAHKSLLRQSLLNSIKRLLDKFGTTPAGPILRKALAEIKSLDWKSA